MRVRNLCARAYGRNTCLHLGARAFLFGRYMAFHDYNGNVSRIIQRAEGLMARYKKPVWITEFAINKWARIGTLQPHTSRSIYKVVLAHVSFYLQKSARERGVCIHAALHPRLHIP